MQRHAIALGYKVIIHILPYHFAQITIWVADSLVPPPVKLTSLSGDRILKMNLRIEKNLLLR